MDFIYILRISCYKMGLSSSSVFVMRTVFYPTFDNFVQSFYHQINKKCNNLQNHRNMSLSDVARLRHSSPVFFYFVALNSKCP